MYVLVCGCACAVILNNSNTAIITCQRFSHDVLKMMFQIAREDSIKDN